MRSASQFRALTLGSPGQFARVSLLESESARCSVSAGLPVTVARPPRPSRCKARVEPRPGGGQAASRRRGAVAGHAAVTVGLGRPWPPQPLGGLAASVTVAGHRQTRTCSPAATEYTCARARDSDPNTSGPRGRERTMAARRAPRQGPAFRSRAGLVPTSPTDSDEDLKLGLKSLSDASDDTCATLCVAPLPVQLPNLEWELFFRTVELPK